MTVLRFIGLGIIVAIAGALLWKLLPARTASIRGADPVADLIQAEIGDMTQWILIRGQDRRAPILLWLHGGPGSAQMPIHAITSDLERDFVVVHWDQRGAGKSNPPGFDPASMTLAQFLSDAHEVTMLLRNRVGTQPIIVLGHSWGTMLGARLVARWPENYAGYVGVGQQVDTLVGAALARDWLREVAPDAPLAAATPEAFRDHERYVDLMQALEENGGGMNVSLLAMLPSALAAPEYRLRDYLAWLDGANRGSGPMWAEYIAYDLRQDLLDVPVPMLLISGARDMNTPVVLVRQWFDSVSAPLGKRMVVFDNSGHAPFLTEAAKFVASLRAFQSELGLEPEGR